MKDCYTITKKVRVVGVLDELNDKKFIRVELKDQEPKLIPLDELLDLIMGSQIKIETEMDED